MKLKLWSTVLCFCLLFLVQLSPSKAQGTPQQPAATQPTAPGQPAAAPPTTPGQAAAQQPAAPQAAPPPPPVPIRVEVRDTGGDAYSIEPFFWLVKTAPNLKLGYASEFTTNAYGQTVPNQTTPGDLKFPGGSKYGDGVVVTVPTTSENSLQFTYFRVQGGGTTTASQNLILYGNLFPAGDVLDTSYALQDFKLSWNYLMYPAPSHGAKFRVKALFEFQYVDVAPFVAAPYDINTTNTTGTKNIFLPTLGIGLEYHPTKSLRFEFKGSGFGILHRADLWDAEALLVWRAGHLEAAIGGKAFHFKTSPKADQYLSDTLIGPEVALRWIFK